MKVKVKDNDGFQPIELTIIIENKGELCSLWHRFNLTPSAVEKVSKSLDYGCLNDGDLFIQLDNLVSKYVLNSNK